MLLLLLKAQSRSGALKTRHWHSSSPVLCLQKRERERVENKVNSILWNKFDNLSVWHLLFIITTSVTKQQSLRSLLCRIITYYVEAKVPETECNIHVFILKRLSMRVLFLVYLVVNSWELKEFAIKIGPVALPGAISDYFWALFLFKSVWISVMDVFTMYLFRFLVHTQDRLLPHSFQTRRW